MEKTIQVTEKFEYQGWPSISRPDLCPPSGWNLSIVTAQERYRNHQLSKDGKLIAFIKDTETLSDIYTLSTDGGWPSRITTNRELVAHWDDEIPQISPDGEYLAFCINGHVNVVKTSGGIPEIITDFTTNAWAPRWMPDSKQIIVSTTRTEADQLLLTDIHGRWPRALTNSSNGDHWDPQPSPSGEKIAFTFRPFEDLNRLDICVIDLENSVFHTIYSKARIRSRDARWSPDGQWIAFITQENGNDDLWLAKSDGENLHQITQLGHAIVQYTWSPDGNNILFTVNKEGAIDLSIIELSTGVVTPLRSDFGVYSNPNWSQSGKFITYEFESPIHAPEIFRLDLESKASTQLTFSFLPALSAKKMINPERVSYKSFDGLEIPSLLFLPKKQNGAAIVYPHGGPSAQYCLEWDIFAQYLLAKGYTILAPNYRGSTGYGVAFEHANYGVWGTDDTKDCLSGAKFLNTLSGIDPSRLAIMGGSYGGYLVNCCLARDPEYLFACGIAKYGDADTLSSWALCKRELRLYTEIFLGHPTKNRDKYITSSPINNVSNVQKPILILHGLEDDTVPPEASEQWMVALKEQGKTFEYKTYSREPHGFLRRETLLDVYSRIERFLDWYLLP